MINWKSLGFGIALAIIIYYLLVSSGMLSLTILGFIIAPLIGGYILGGDLKVGAIHGVIINFLGIIIASFSYAALVSYFAHVPIFLGNNVMTLLSIITLIALFIIYAVIGAVFAVVGVVIKNKLMERQ